MSTIAYFISKELEIQDFCTDNLLFVFLAALLSSYFYMPLHFHNLSNAVRTQSTI